MHHDVRHAGGIKGEVRAQPIEVRQSASVKVSCECSRFRGSDCRPAGSGASEDVPAEAALAWLEAAALAAAGLWWPCLRAIASNLRTVPPSLQTIGTCIRTIGASGCPDARGAQMG